MQVVELAGLARLHVHVATPGLPGEADLVKRALASLDPAVVVADLDTREALSLRGEFTPGFVDGLVAAHVNARYAKGDAPGDHPLVAAARIASTRKADLVALRPTASKPGFFARRRATRALADITADGPDAFARAAVPALERARVWSARADADAALPRLERVLAGGRAPVALVAQAHRAGALLELLGRSVE